MFARLYITMIRHEDKMSEIKKLKPIFSGERSVNMWNHINNAKTIEDLKEALYTICCHLQALETRLEQEEYKERRKE